LQVLLELRHRLLVYAGATLVLLDPPIGLPNGPLGDLKRLWLRLAHPTPPTRRRLAAKQARTTLPLRSSPITEPSSLLRVGPPLCPASLLCPSQIGCLGFSLQTTGRRPKPLHWPGRPIGATGSRVPHESPDHARATIHAGHPPGQSAGSRQANPGATTRPRFRTSSIRFRHFNGGLLSLAFVIDT
jgi:hypothetical protein